MADTGIRPRPHPSGLLAAGLATALLGWLAGPGAGAAAADSTPTPLPSAGATTEPAVRLPVMPSLLDLTQNSCTEPSTTSLTAVPWAQENLELSRAQQLTTGAGVKVAVIDTGVSRTAPALAGRVTGLGSDATSDCVGHGTLIAGLIAAAPASGTGFVGVAPAADILAVSGIDASGAPDEALVAAGIRSATDAGAGVIDVSLSFPTSTDALTSAISYAQKHDVVVVAPGVSDTLAATGDTSEGRPTATYWPAAQPGVLSVVDLDIDGARPDSAVDPARSDLAAPGQGITGIGPTGSGDYLANGPSAAAAFVAGAAALLRSYEPGLSASEVTARLTAGAYPAAVPRLDLYGALAAVLPSSTASASPPATSHAIHLTFTTEDTTPARRAYAILGAAVFAALVLTGAALLRRRRGRRLG